MEQVIKNRCLNGSVHVYVESLKWNIISDKYLQWREVSSWDEGKQVYFVKQVKLLLYWKGLQSSLTILGQLPRAFQLEGLVGIAMESVIAGARMECAASFCCVVHPHIGILPLLSILAITVWTSGIILFWSLIVIFHPLGRDYSIIGELTVAWNIGLPSFRKLSFG